jgi:hypothetical protein
MSLRGIRASRKTANKAAIIYALEHSPALVVDCSNCANIHKFFPDHPQAKFDEVYVLELELLYKYRDTLLQVHNLAVSRGCRTIVVTSATHMMHYGDEGENLEMFTHIWENLQELGRMYDVVVAVDDDIHFLFAKRYGAQIVTVEELMGHTVWSQRVNLEHIIGELNQYSRSLRPDERKIVQDLLREPFKHVGSISYANSVHAWSFLLLSIIIEQEKRLRVVERKYAGVVDRQLQEQEQHSIMVEDAG